MKAEDESIDPDQFRRFCREGMSKDGSLASRMVLACIGTHMTLETLSDELIDGLFGEIDDDGGGEICF